MLHEFTNDGHNAITVLVVGRGSEQRAATTAALGAVSEPATEVIEAELDGKVELRQAQVMMVVFEDDEETPLNLLVETCEQAARPIIFALLPKRSPSLMRRALRAGADELLFLPLDADEVARALFKISEARRRKVPGRYGKVISLFSMVGGVGTTTLAAYLSLGLLRLGKRVATVDLDLQLGSLGVLLNIESARSIVDLADPEKKLDSIQLDLTLAKHPSGLALLAAPKLIEDSERVSEATVRPVIDLIAQLFDFVIVDCGTNVNENVVAACDRSDQVLYVLDQSLESVRGAWRFMELLGRLGAATVEPKFILNRFAPRNLISENRIATTLAQPIYARIVRDDKNLERARWSSNDISKMALRSPFLRSIDQLANSLAIPPSERSGGLMARLWSAVGARLKGLR